MGVYLLDKRGFAGGEVGWWPGLALATAADCKSAPPERTAGVGP